PSLNRGQANWPALYAAPTGLVDLESGALHHRRPARDLLLEVHGELLGRAAHRLDAEQQEGLAHLRQRHRLRDLAAQAADDGGPRGESTPYHASTSKSG